MTVHRRYSPGGRLLPPEDVIAFVMTKLGGKKYHIAGEPIPHPTIVSEATGRVLTGGYLESTALCGYKPIRPFAPQPLLPEYHAQAAICPKCVEKIWKRREAA